jgi:hypothetical protein
VTESCPQKGATDEERKQLLLLPAAKYRYLTMGGVIDVPELQVVNVCVCVCVCVCVLCA